MPLNFPEIPALNQYYVFNGIRWRWNGYAWVSAGVCGGSGVFAGISGDYVQEIIGGIGVTVSGPTGSVEVSLRLDEPNIGPAGTPITHTAPSSFSADTGLARKVAFLEGNGGITFDFIKNYDVFRQAEFLFEINSFTIPGLNPQLIGAVGTNIDLNPFQAQMSYNQAPVEVRIDLLAPSTGNAFPIIVTSPGLNTHNFISTDFLTYRNFNGVNDYFRFRLGATGENNDGTLSYKTKNFDAYFYNYVFYGYTFSTSISGSNFNESTFNPVLNGSRSYIININIPQGDPNPNYLYYAYPARLGVAAFRDNATNLEGGFAQQIGVFSYTNSKSFTENYVIYRSEQGNLGNVSITVS